MKFFAEISNATLSVNGGSRVRRIFQDIRTFCKGVSFYRDEEDESSDSE